MAILKTTLAVCGAATLLSVFGYAQTPEVYYPGLSPSNTQDVYRVNYFRYADIGAGPGDTSFEVDIVDPASNWNVGNGQNYATVSPAIDICADIYIYNEYQEFEACCGCALSPNELLYLSAGALLYNPVNPTFESDNGVIKIVSSTLSAGGQEGGFPGLCNPALPTPTPTLREWMNQDSPVAPGNAVESEFSYAPLGAAELKRLKYDCGNVINYGTSGAGYCYCPGDFALGFPEGAATRSSARAAKKSAAVVKQ